MSYMDVLCPEFAFSTGCNEPKTKGTLVQVGPNRGPVYEIVSIEGPTAWIREPVTFRSEALVPVDRLRVIEASASPVHFTR
jgi:hypothetical protein